MKNFIEQILAKFGGLRWTPKYRKNIRENLYIGR